MTEQGQSLPLTLSRTTIKVSSSRTRQGRKPYRSEANR